MTEITSTQNSIFRKYLSLQESKGIKKHQLCLVMGERLVNEFISQELGTIEAVLSNPSYDLGNFSSFNVLQFSKELFREIDEFGTHHPILSVQCPAIENYQTHHQFSDGLTLICSTGDPANLGATIRSADAFAVKKVIISEEGANPFLPKSIRSSSNSVFRVPLLSGPKLSDFNFPTVIALDLEGEELQSFEWPKNCALMVGEEGKGIPSNLKDIRRVKIQMAGNVESLNANVAASIAMNSYFSYFARK